MELKWRDDKWSFVEFRQFRINLISQKFESCAIEFNLKWLEDVKVYKNKQTNREFDWDFLNLVKNGDFEIALWKKSRLRDTHNR